MAPPLYRYKYKIISYWAKINSIESFGTLAII